MDARASLERPRRRRRTMHPRTATAVVRAACCCCALLSTAAGFSPSAIAPERATIATSTRHMHNNNNSPRRTTRLRNLFDDFDGDEVVVDDSDFEGYDPAVSAQIRKAKQLLVDAKKKQEAAAKSSADGTSGHSGGTSGGHDAGEALPFFATQSLTAAAASHSSAKIKSKLASGAIVADGDAMSSLAQSEPWERRSLGQMFRREAREDYDGNTVEGDDIDGRVLGDKDLARNIFNLRRQLQDGDFKRVFDSRNRFIGEVD